MNKTHNVENSVISIYSVYANTVLYFFFLQGQERDIVILSFVRSNRSSQIGFLAQRQRLNVALTRARKSCFLVASLSSLSDNADYKSLVEDATKRGVVSVVTEREENDKSYLKFLFR